MDTSGCCGPNSALRCKFFTPTEYARALGKQHLTQYRICKEPNIILSLYRQGLGLFLEGAVLKELKGNNSSKSVGSLIGKSFYCLAGKVFVSKSSSAGWISPQACLLGYRKYWLRQHMDGEPDSSCQGEKAVSHTAMGRKLPLFIRAF